MYEQVPRTTIAGFMHITVKIISLQYLLMIKRSQTHPQTYFLLKSSACYFSYQLHQHLSCSTISLILKYLLLLNLQNLLWGIDLVTNYTFIPLIVNCCAATIQQVSLTHVRKKTLQRDLTVFDYCLVNFLLFYLDLQYLLLEVPFKLVPQRSFLLRIFVMEIYFMVQLVAFVMDLDQVA